MYTINVVSKLSIVVVIANNFRKGNALLYKCILVYRFVLFFFWLLFWNPHGNCPRNFYWSQDICKS